MEDLERQHYLQRLQASNRELQNFVYAVSHDLSAPLQHIMFFAADLQSRLEMRLTGEERDDFERIIASSKRLHQLVYELLQYSRLESSGLASRPMDGTQLLLTAINNLEVAIKDSHAEIVYQPLPCLVVDGTQITQLFQNLIDNALKFRSDHSPHIVIKAVDEGDFWQVSVSDNGIGIDARFHSEIFTIFRRLHTEQEFPGTGVGLALCRRIVQRHGGEIWVESERHKGSTFCFTLPKKPPAHADLKNFKGFNGVCVL